MDLSQEPFNPYHLRPLATLNSRSIIDLPRVDPRCVGRGGWELLSRRALIDLVRERAADAASRAESPLNAAELGLEQVDPGEYPRVLYEALERGEGPLYPAALAIATEFGRRLGWLLASIVLSPKGLTAPLSPWEAGYLRWWREEVREIALGGGHASGELGQSIARAVETTLAECGLAGRSIRPAKNPSYLPLIGAARSLPGVTASTRVVCDFGGTRAKRGIAFYNERGQLARLEVLPPRDISAITAAGDVPGLAARMIEIIVETARALLIPPEARILCSIAAYTQAGRPLNIDRGIYTWLNRIDPDIKAWFSRQVSAACGREMTVEFGHDCDLAACALAGSPHAAVVMMGSALGVGFVPPLEGYAEMAEGFRITSL